MIFYNFEMPYFSNFLCFLECFEVLMFTFCATKKCMFKVRHLWGKNPKTMRQGTTSKDNSKQNIHEGKRIFEQKKTY